MGRIGCKKVCAIVGSLNLFSPDYGLSDTLHGGDILGFHQFDTELFGTGKTTDISFEVTPQVNEIFSAGKYQVVKDCMSEHCRYHYSQVVWASAI
jgi:hypothetical protein